MVILILGFGTLFSQFLPVGSFLLPPKNFYHFFFLNLIPDKPKEVILFAGGEMVITDLSGKIIGQYLLPKRILMAYPCSTTTYLVTKEGLYRLRFLNLVPKLEILERKEILASFPISPFQFALRTRDKTIVYNLTEGMVRELFSLPLREINSGCRRKDKFYLAESTALYEFDQASGECKKILSTTEKILGIFNLGGSLYYLKKKGRDLYLVRYEPDKKTPVKSIPIIAQKGKTAIREVSPFLFLKNQDDLYLIFPSGFKKKVSQGLIDLALTDLNGDGLTDCALLRSTRVEKFLNQRRDFLTKREKAVERFSLLARREEWLGAERAFLMANIFNDQAMGEEVSLRELRRNTYTAYYIKRWTKTFSTLLLLILPIIFAIFLLRRTIHKRRSLVKREVREIVNIAYEVITLDHNFVVKGNLPSALRKLEELFARYRIPKEKFLPNTWDEKNYKEFLARFLSSPHLRSLRRFLEERILEIGQSWDCVKISPEIEDVLGYFDKTIEAVFTHIFSDNFRYAKTFAQIKVSYLVPTEWSKKVKLSFFSDGETVPSLGDGHLAEDLRSLTFRYGNYIAYGAGIEKDEKLWVTFLDIVGIIKGIMKR